MPSNKHHVPQGVTIRQIIGWSLSTIVVIVLAYACYSILGIFFGR